MQGQTEQQQPNVRKKSGHAPGAVRHAEKRRTGTCRFADRVATVSLDCFRTHVPMTTTTTQQQTCVATIVAHFTSNDSLRVLSLGVGTKFLPESVLQQEHEHNDDNISGATTASSLLEGMDGHMYPQMYGRRVRDCHAEVLARRGFRRQLYAEMVEPAPGGGGGILERILDNKFRLAADVTLHMYSSSAPCGNATLKKFATMQKETFDPAMKLWPSNEHPAIPPHSRKLGQFALLLKKDRNVTPAVIREPPNLRSTKPCPAIESDDWCPPGTTIVWSNQGSLHTCSDKICRWNYLGLQGSLLASMLEAPLCMASLTVGRKFTSCICRRAVCCRAMEKPTKQNRETSTTDEVPPTYSLHHPALMGTGVYMDDSGVLGMSQESEFGQDVRFNSPFCYVWWVGKGQSAECIDGNTGFAVANEEGVRVSSVATVALLRLHCNMDERKDIESLVTFQSVHAFKTDESPQYEVAKERLLSKHPVFQGWRRRIHNYADKKDV